MVSGIISTIQFASPIYKNFNTQLLTPVSPHRTIKLHVHDLYYEFI